MTVLEKLRSMIVEEMSFSIKGLRGSMIQAVIHRMTEMFSSPEYEKGKKESVELSEASAKTGWKLYHVYDINSKLWKEMKYDLRDQFDELVKVGEDYGVFVNAKGTFSILKQIKRLMDKIS